MIAQTSEAIEFENNRNGAGKGASSRRLWIEELDRQIAVEKKNKRRVWFTFDRAFDLWICVFYGVQVALASAALSPLIWFGNMLAGGDTPVGFYVFWGAAVGFAVTFSVCLFCAVRGAVKEYMAAGRRLRELEKQLEKLKAEG